MMDTKQENVVVEKVVRGWINVGDVNPREHGGTFVRRKGDIFTVVEVRKFEDFQTEDSFYYSSCADYYLKELEEAYQGKKEPYNCANWGEIKKGELFYHFLASDMLLYYGGSTRDRSDTNFYKLLRSYCVYRWK